MAMATSMPPEPMASIPMAPAAGVWLSDPTIVLPGTPKRSWWTGWLTPLPGRLNQIPNFRQALRRKRWSSGFLLSSWMRLWSTYWAESSVRARSSPMASSSSMTSVPVASWVRVWSIRRPISSPGIICPSSRCDSISFCATFRPTSVSLRSSVPGSLRRRPVPAPPESGRSPAPRARGGKGRTDASPPARTGP